MDLSGTTYKTLEDLEEDKKFIVDRIIECYESISRERAQRQLNHENLTPREIQSISRGRVPIGVFGKPFYVVILFN